MYNSNEHKPRLCRLVIWSNFEGYGFNLHAEKSRPGQYIGKVDEGSPAAAAGLKEGDRIIEVNGVNISQENHRQVVQRIKALPREAELLVVDKETDDLFKERGEVIKSYGAVKISSELEHPEPIPDVPQEEEEEEEDKKSYYSDVSTSSNKASEIDRSQEKTGVIPEENGEVVPMTACVDLRDYIDRADDEDSKPEHNLSDDVTVENGLKHDRENDENEKIENERTDGEDDLNEIKTSQEAENEENENIEKSESMNDTHLSINSNEKQTAMEMGSTGNSASPRSTPSPDMRADYSSEDSLNLNMTAAEMRMKIGAKKKRDPRMDDRMDIRKKFEIIETL